jgi:hypothetical protein
MESLRRIKEAAGSHPPLARLQLKKTGRANCSLGLFFWEIEPDPGVGATQATRAIRAPQSSTCCGG